MEHSPTDSAGCCFLFEVVPSTSASWLWMLKLSVCYARGGDLQVLLDSSQGDTTGFWNNDAAWSFWLLYCSSCISSDAQFGDKKTIRTTAQNKYISSIISYLCSFLKVIVVFHNNKYFKMGFFSVQTPTLLSFFMYLFVCPPRKTPVPVRIMYCTCSYVRISFFSPHNISTYVPALN